MSRKKDHGPEGNAAQSDAEREPMSYYYDDSTGYEVYNPAEDDEDEDPLADEQPPEEA